MGAVLSPTDPAILIPLFVVYGLIDAFVATGRPVVQIALERVFDFPIAPEERIQEVHESPAPYAQTAR